MVSRFDKYLRNGDKQGPIEKTPEKPWQSQIFLITSFIFIVLAVLTYVFEDSLLWMNASGTTFMFLIGFFVLAALFFLSAYRMPKLGMWLLGRSLEINDDPEAKVKGTKFDIFTSEGGMEFKSHQSKVKQARHARRKFGKGQKVNPAASVDDSGMDAKGGDGNEHANDASHLESDD